MYRRLIARRIEEALEDTPVVLLIGPRRAGKTTLVRQIAGDDRRYVTLDDQTVLDAARSDPIGFVRGLDRVIIDEIQRAPELLLAIKKSVDEDYRPGRFLLTGSANVMTLPRVADSLAGRIETLVLLPLARAEIDGVLPSFLDHLFDADFQSSPSATLGDDLVALVLSGGFPEALGRRTERRRLDWGRAYLTSVLTRDLRDIADIANLSVLPKFLRLLAEHSGQLINYSKLGAGIGVSHKTGQRYLRLLEQILLVSTLSPWTTNALKRLTKTPKVHFVDSGLLAAARGLTLDRVRGDRRQLGAMLESFVFSEVQKLSAESDMRLTSYHFRDAQMNEVDLVLERDDGRVAGIEIKASATVNASDFRGLRHLARNCGERFACGVVLYDSAETVFFDRNLIAAPISTLWGAR
ncbi:MAG: ATP-binding protein [Myxococcota bacterium]